MKGRGMQPAFERRMVRREFGDGEFACAPSGLASFPGPTHGLRRGLHSVAAPRQLDHVLQFWPRRNSCLDQCPFRAWRARRWAGWTIQATPMLKMYSPTMGAANRHIFRISVVGVKMAAMMKITRIE